MTSSLALFAAALIQSPAAPACPIVENFTIVPFESGSAVLSTRTRSQIEAWLRSYRYPPARIDLLGNADRVGTRRANQWLSVRRVRAIRAYLVSLGIPRERISIRGTGEDQLVIETGDGVPEAQNRIVWLSVMPDEREPRC